MKQNKKISVLITAASRRVALVESFKKIVGRTGGAVIAVDWDIYSSALYFADKFYKVPKIKSKDYVKTIKKIAKKEGVRLIIPSIDMELSIWAREKEEFKKSGIIVSVSSEKTIEICADKYKTYEIFKENNIPFAKSYTKDNLPKKLDFPLFIKPRFGRGSDDTFLINDKRDFDFYIEKVENPIISEYLKGDEFTTDAFFSKDGKLLRLVHRYREIVRAGVSDRGKTFKNDKLTDHILTIGDVLSFTGAVNIQGKINGGEIRFFEINPRFSGGIQLTVAAGVNFADLLVKELLDDIIEPNYENFQEGLTMISYAKSIFLDINGDKK